MATNTEEEAAVDRDAVAIETDKTKEKIKKKEPVEEVEDMTAEAAVEVTVEATVEVVVAAEEAVHLEIDPQEKRSPLTSILISENTILKITAST